MAIRVTGLRELQADMKKADRLVERKLLRDDLKKASQPVADAGREKIGHYRGAQVSRIRPVVTNRSVFVRQSASRKTGKRPDFGSLQWHLLSDALDENEDKVREGVETALENVLRRADL